MATIILTGGGTAGHCIPALSLIPYLKDNFENIYYIGSENGIEKNIVKSYNIIIDDVNLMKFSFQSYYIIDGEDYYFAYISQNSILENIQLIALFVAFVFCFKVKNHKVFFHFLAFLQIIILIHLDNLLNF